MMLFDAMDKDSRLVKLLNPADKIFGSIESATIASVAPKPLLQTKSSGGVDKQIVANCDQYCTEDE